MKDQIIELIKNNSPEEAAKKILKLVVKADVSGSISTPSKAMDDYEFNMHRHWKDEPKTDDDDYGGTIKHFRD